MSDLVSHVHLLGDGGEYVVFGPGDEVPDWAARKMGSHCFVDGDHPFGGPDDESEEAPGSGEPTRSGRGSGRDAWVAFANSKGVEVDESASRDDIIATLADAGHIDA